LPAEQRFARGAGRRRTNKIMGTLRVPTPLADMVVPARASGASDSYRRIERAGTVPPLFALVACGTPAGHA
jgi:hypothetical protein